MITYDKIQSFMRTLRDDDMERRSVNVSGQTLQDALEQASIELQAPISDIEYEIIDKGSSGVLGVGRKPVMILAYAAQKAVAAAQFDSEMGFDLGFEDLESQDQDGEALVKFTPDGILFKVKPPIGSGEPITIEEAMEVINHRTSASIDKSTVTKAVKRADDEWVVIGEYEYNPANDASMTVEMVDSEMKALLTLHPPGPGGADPSAKVLQQFLQSSGVVAGIKDSVIERIDESPTYGEEILVAEGKPPVNGKDARIQYTFETNPQNMKLKEDEKGRVDFKELNLVQNVVEGQALAKKIPPEPGEDGYTVTGKTLPASNGQDRTIEVGKNVKLTDDGVTAISLINGQVMIHNNKIVVDPIYTVDGDVNLKTGNVTFLGTVLVKGTVEDGFTVKASGNIEIHGSVGKSEIDAEGDVTVHQGITGRNEGMVRCGRSLFAKFIENANVQVGEYLVVSDGIINSQVNCNRRILCQGKRATIVGGHLRASEEIAARTLGSVAGAETILEVGYDPKKREELEELQQREEEIKKELEEVSLNVEHFENAVKEGKKLEKEKQQQYYDQRKRRADLEAEMQDLNEKMEEIKKYLHDLKSQGRISASGTVFQGVKVYVREASQEIRSEYTSVTFVNEDDMIKINKYVEPESIPIGR